MRSCSGAVVRTIRSSHQSTSCPYRSYGCSGRPSMRAGVPRSPLPPWSSRSRVAATPSRRALDRSAGDGPKPARQ